MMLTEYQCELCMVFAQFNVAMQTLHSIPYKLPLNKYAYWYKHLCEDHSLVQTVCGMTFQYSTQIHSDWRMSCSLQNLI